MSEQSCFAAAAVIPEHSLSRTAGTCSLRTWCWHSADTHPRALQAHDAAVEAEAAAHERDSAVREADRVHVALRAMERQLAAIQQRHQRQESAQVALLEEQVRSRDAQLRELRRQLHALLRCAPPIPPASAPIMTAAVVLHTPSTTSAAALPGEHAERAQETAATEHIRMCDVDSDDSSSSSDEETQDLRMSSRRTTRPPLAALSTNAPAVSEAPLLSKPHAAVDEPSPVPPQCTLQRLNALKAHAELLLSDEAP